MSLLLQKEIEKVKKKILSLSTFVEESLQRAVKSVEERDGRLAKKVIDTDLAIDHMEIDVEEEILKILALHQPVAVDLRFLVAVLKINNDLERIGDLAVNIAERSSFLSKHAPSAVPFVFSEMARKVQGMLNHALNSLINIDSGLAREVLQMDNAVDCMNRETYDRVKQAILQHPDDTDIFIHFLSVSRYLERIADHATNIAEDVIYMIEGEIVRHRLQDVLAECPPSPVPKTQA